METRASRVSPLRHVQEAAGRGAGLTPGERVVALWLPGRSFLFGPVFWAVGLSIRRPSAPTAFESGGRRLVHESKRARHDRLRAVVEREPFLTDEELAACLGVSVQTIRLDRMALGIPELRERLRSIATSNRGLLRSLALDEIFGDVVDLQLGQSGISVWRPDPGHGFSRSGIIRGHFIFAQANSLAVAIVDAEEALTAKATVRYLNVARPGETLVAKATARGERHGYVRVSVDTKIGHDAVFRGEFLILRSGGADVANQSDPNRR